MLVETKVVGSGGTESRTVAVPPGTATLRDLLAVLVGHELASYERERTTSRTLRVLTPADLARGVDDGAYGGERRTLAAPPTEAEATARALEAFGDGLFFAFVDDVQVEDLDASLALHATSTLRLVRLVALAGG